MKIIKIHDAVASNSSKCLLAKNINELFNVYIDFRGSDLALLLISKNESEDVKIGMTIGESVFGWRGEKLHKVELRQDMHLVSHAFEAALNKSEIACFRESLNTYYEHLNRVE